MNEEFNELVRKRVGDSLRNVPVMKRVAMLQANARFLRKQTRWTPPADDGPRSKNCWSFTLTTV